MSKAIPSVHPYALCDTFDVGPGTRVWPFAHIMKGAVVGADCNIGGGAFIEAGVTIGDGVTVKNHALLWRGVSVDDHAFIGPNVVFTNDKNPRAAFKKPTTALESTHVGRSASIGANATILCGVTIGRGAFVGAGSVVIDDVPPHALVVGNPAHRVGWMCACGERLDEDLGCACGRKYASDADGLRQAAGPATP